MQSEEILEDLVGQTQEIGEFFGLTFETLEDYWALADARLSAFANEKMWVVVSRARLYINRKPLRFVLPMLFGFEANGGVLNYFTVSNDECCGLHGYRRDLQEARVELLAPLWCPCVHAGSWKIRNANARITRNQKNWRTKRRLFA